MKLDPSPEVQLLGDAALIRGMAALDAYRLLTEGIQAVRRRDGIEPNKRLLQSVAVLKLAASASSATTDIADDRRPVARSESVRTGEVIGMEEAARMYGCDVRHARRFASSWGGWRGAGRGRPWRFDRGLVQSYIDLEAAK